MATVFSKLGAVNVAVDMIVQNVSEGGKAEISFTVLGRTEEKGGRRRCHRAADKRCGEHRGDQFH
jgi:hypothetical protein